MAKQNNIEILKLLQDRIGSADWSKWGVNRWTFYDYVRYPSAGTVQIPFFSVPIGATDPNSGLGKTAEQTNAPKSRSFGQVYFILKQIRTHLFVLPKNRQPSGISQDNNVITDTYRLLMNKLYALLGQGVLTIKIGQKDYFEISQPFRFCPPGFGVDIDQHAASVDRSWWMYQSSDPNDVFMIEPAQLIEPEQIVETTIDFPNGVTPSLVSSLGEGITPSVDIGMLWDGYLVRPVQ